MSDAIETIRKGNKIARIFPDCDAANPRTEWDNLATIYYTSSRYVLGDEQVDSDEINRIMNDPTYLYLPVFAYIHSGVTLKTGTRNPFSCPWDSGMSGIVAISKADLRKELGKQRISKKAREYAKGVMESEVATYTQFLEGDVYGIEVEEISAEDMAAFEADEIDEEDLEGEPGESCWGFYGFDYARQEAESMLS